MSRNPDRSYPLSFLETSPGKFLKVLLVGLLVYPFVKYGFWYVWNYVGVDWPMFYRASVDLWEGRSPYLEDLLTGENGDEVRAWGHYLYPPFFARLLTPLIVFSESLSKKVYLILCLGLYLYLFLPGKGGGKNDGVGRFLAFAVLLGWGPVLQTFRYGQSNFVPLFFIAFAWKLLAESNKPLSPDRKWGGWREGAAWSLVGVAAAVKLTPLIMLPVLFALGRFRAAAALVAGFALATVLSGPVTSYQFFTSVLPTLANFPETRHPYAINVLAINLGDWLFHRGWIDEAALDLFPRFGLALSGILFAGLLAFLYRRRDKISASDALFLTFYLPALFAGVWFHHYALVIPPLLYLLRRLADRKAWFWLGIVFLALTPGFTFWAPVKAVFSLVFEVTPAGASTLFMLGQAVVFPMFLRELLFEERGDSSPLPPGEG